MNEVFNDATVCRQVFILRTVLQHYLLLVVCKTHSGVAEVQIGFLFGVLLFIFCCFCHCLF